MGVSQAEERESCYSGMVDLEGEKLMAESHKIKPGSMASIVFPGKTHFKIEFEGPTPQEWVCEGCGLSGTASYDSGRGDVLSVVRAIRDHHETLASKYAPLCHFDVDQVRVRNDALMNVYEWNRLVAKIEKSRGR